MSCPKLCRVTQVRNAGRCRPGTPPDVAPQTCAVAMNPVPGQDCSACDAGNVSRRCHENDAAQQANDIAEDGDAEESPDGMRRQNSLFDMNEALQPGSANAASSKVWLPRRRIKNKAHCAGAELSVASWSTLPFLARLLPDASMRERAVGVHFCSCVARAVRYIVVPLLITHRCKSPPSANANATGSGSVARAAISSHALCRSSSASSVHCSLSSCTSWTRKHTRL